MDVILSKSSKLGSAGSIVKVAAGYAFNFLIPRGIASAATSAAISDFESKKDLAIQKEKEQQNKANTFIQSTPNSSVFIYKNSINADGKLYGSISDSEIIESINIAFAKKLSTIESGFVVSKHDLIMEKRVASYGVYEAKIRLAHDSMWHVSVIVSKDNDSAIKLLGLANAVPVPVAEKAQV